MKCQLLVFSYLFEVEPLQGCRNGCFDSFTSVLVVVVFAHIALLAHAPRPPDRYL